MTTSFNEDASCLVSGRGDISAIRVLSVVHYNGAYGGPQNRNARLAPLLYKRGFEITVVLPSEPGSAADELRKRGVDVVQVSLHRPRATLNPLPHMGLLWGFWPEVMHIVKLIERRKIDVVLINGSIFPHAALAARLAKVPVVWQLLDTRPPMWMRRVAMYFVRRFADVVMSTGMEVARQHPKACDFGDRLISFFPPVDTTEFRPDKTRREMARKAMGVPEEAVLVGTVGNLTRQKGHGYFINVVAGLLKENRSVYARVVGQRVATHDRYAERLRARAQRLGLFDDGRFAFYDAGTAVADLLPGFDVFLMTSEPLSEGIPTSVLEAMSCGLPVIATDVGSIRETIRDGKNGFVVPAVNEHALIENSLSLVRDRSLREEIGTEARRAAICYFDAEQTADAHVRAFKIAMARHNADSGVLA